MSAHESGVFSGHARCPRPRWRCAHDSIARDESGYPIAAFNDYAIWRAFDNPGRQDVRPSPCCSMASQSATRASIIREWSTSSLVHRCDGMY
jgi:hypothetical protein